MIHTLSATLRVERMVAAGFGKDDACDWAGSVAAIAMPANAKRGSAIAAVEGADAEAPRTGTVEALNRDAAEAEPVFARGWEMLDALPSRSQRSAVDRAAGEAILHGLLELCRRLCRSHREPIYARLTAARSRAVRLEALVEQAAELWPGLVPTAAELSREAQRMQHDKDGREIQQGILVGELCSDPVIGTHLLRSMLLPTEAALELSEQFRREGSMDLGTVLVEAREGAGHVGFRNPDYLNAEDDETLEAQEVAVDLVLLHPELRMGVLRGEPVNHQKYAGRRIFSAGINLTNLYHGNISFLFYLVREMGLVNKIYRGHAAPSPSRDATALVLDGAEGATHEIPWMAVVEGFAIGGGCQLLLVVDHVIAESGAYFNLPARKEGIIPGCANLRLARFLGERLARQAILFDATFPVDTREGRRLVNEVHPVEEVDDAVRAAIDNALGSGLVSAAGNRTALRVGTEPLDALRRYLAVYAAEQAFCHLSEQLTSNLERHWDARQKSPK